ncbi:MAG: NAD-dependent epimerase/dehydratase family protein, partial [Planctomycetes bacterium]|nr:NAD-dependent epimerase/dehydratase family protein [Planctomycetota bacterium]
MTKTWFVTGALGCIGAWVVKTILDRGDAPVVFDLGGDPRRIRDVVEPEAFGRIRFVQGDVTDTAAVVAAVQDSGAGRIVHLAGLQVPFCKADPPAGARVNVLGTINVFQAALAAGLERVAYASSAAVYGPDDFGPGGSPPDEGTACQPTTHYGGHKL